MRIFNIFTILILMSCSSKSKNKSKNNITQVYTKIEQELTSGKWTLCKVMNVDIKTNEGISTNFNVCPKIVFDTNYTGFYINPSLKKDPFEWKLLSRDFLKISGNNKDMVNGVYKMIFNKKSDYLELQLKIKYLGNNIIYFLGK